MWRSRVGSAVVLAQVASQLELVEPAPKLAFEPSAEMMKVADEPLADKSRAELLEPADGPRLKPLELADELRAELHEPLIESLIELISELVIDLPAIEPPAE
ncbi:hypothetical protein Nepgr_016503 [Nepenthes gracilis]|uniref:Uncharacterized protein n=1 Tax=Nepenthes gracilis TaxID=150966 RepID=A0AAD3SPB8_NEPGR|nr:hypothetical protein Nepgr_016503 [Nepenthes gracilis]